MKEITKHIIEKLRATSKLLLKYQKETNTLVEYLAQLEDELENSLKNGNNTKQENA